MHKKLQNPKVSIIIPTLNEEKYLPDLLKSLQNQTFQNFEVIVSDAFSKDETRKIAMEWGAVVVDGGIPSVARNNGVKVAKGEILVFIDADCVFDKDFLEKSLNQFISKELDLACSLLDSKDVKIKHKLIFEIWNLGRVIRQRTKWPHGTTTFMIVKKDTFQSLGFFDESLKVGSDLEFIKRAAGNKYKYRIISTKHKTSPRRFEKYGISAVLLSGFIIGVTLISKNKNIQSNLEKFYGGWSNFKDEEKNEK